MASLKEIAREYRDEIMDGIAWVAIWKTGRSWNAKAFWLNLETERIEDEEMEEAREIVAADPKAIFINEYYTAHMGEGKLEKRTRFLKNWFRRCIAWPMTRKQSQSERWRGQQIRWQRQSLPEKMCMDSQRSTRSRKQTGADTEK